MNFPAYVSPDTYRTIEVLGYIDPKEALTEEFVSGLVPGKGYLYGVPSEDPDEDMYQDIEVWIYAEKKPKMSDEYTYFWIEETDIKFSNPLPEIRYKMKIGNVMDLSIEEVLKETEPNEQLFDSTEISDINSASSSFIPEIYESDDFLKKAVKKCIIEKGIDVNRLKSKTCETYQILNMLAALRSGSPDEPGTKMSTKYFYKWMEILGCKFMLVVADNDTDTQDPLKNNVVYISDNDKVYSEMDDGKLIESVVVSNKEEKD